MQVFAENGHVPIKAWVDGVELEGQAYAQLRNVASLPFIHKHIAVMPDVHFGIGATVGSVIPTLGAIIPAAVGVDIGCGMMAVRTNLKAKDLPDNLSGVRSAIEAVVPVGFAEHKERQSWDQQMALDLMRIAEKHKPLDHYNKARQQLGTLGGGNHFIELCLDENQDVWIMLHSGSRGIGNMIGTYFIELAREDMRRHFINLPDKDLAYFPEGTEHFNDYVHAVHWAQQYAMANRQHMMKATLMALDKVLGIFPITGFEQAINCHHNYVQKEHHYGADPWVTRKGAVRARAGDLGIIPGSMGAKSFIVRGLGNEESFCSCSHGAGRRMSRGQAKKLLTLADHERDTAGVECRKDADVLDESPGAYKSIDAVMAAQSDLVEIVHTLKQVVCIKG